MKKIFAGLTLAIIGFFSVVGAAAEEIDYKHEISEADLRADFAALYEGLKSAHYDLFVHRTKSEYDARYKKMALELDTPLTLFDAHVRFQEFVAFGNVAHARIDFPEIVYRHYRQGGGRAFPIFLRIVDGRAYIGEDYSGLEDIHLGDEIIEINGASINDLLARTARRLSADTPYIAHSLLEFSFPMYLWLELGEVDQFRVKLKPKGKRVRTVTVAAGTLAQAREVAANNQEVLFSLDTQTREARMLDGNIAYLRPGPFYNVEKPEAIWDNTAFVAFIDQAFDGFIEQDAKALIIDVRQNPGGDNSFSDPMVAWFADQPFKFASAIRIKSSPQAAASNQARLDANPGAVKGVSGLLAKKYAQTPAGEIFEFDIPEMQPLEGRRFEGDVFVLVNRNSYSNAVNVAAMVQDYGFGKVIGEKTSDLATTYGSMETFRLPITGIKVGFPKSHIIRPSGEEKSDGVTPDILIETPISPTDKDMVLNAAHRLICDIRKQ